MREKCAPGRKSPGKRKSSRPERCTTARDNWLDSTTVGSVTGQDGTFVLLLPEREGVLVFSFIGYETVRVKYSGENTPLFVTLKEKVAALDEVTVIAYGTQNKREVVGAMSTVKGEDLEDIPSPSLANLLQGRWPA
ncbi:MAG: carboxypeptidase-like regulatory domain-containing protein [Butyricimonas faecalis]